MIFTKVVSDWSVQPKEITQLCRPSLQPLTMRPLYLMEYLISCKVTCGIKCLILFTQGQIQEPRFAHT